MANLDVELNQLELQHNFVTTIVLPLWTALVATIPDLRHRIDQIEENRAFYKNAIERLKKPKLSPPPSPRPKRVETLQVDVEPASQEESILSQIEQVIAPLSPTTRKSPAPSPR